MPWVECINPHQLLELTTLESRSTTDGDADGADAGIVHDHSASNDDSGAVAGIPLPLVQSQDGGGSGIECSGTGGGAKLPMRLHRAWAVSAQHDGHPPGENNDSSTGIDGEGSARTTGEAISAAQGDSGGGSSSCIEVALSQARAEAEQRGAAGTVVCGSLYLVGEFLRLVERRTI